MLNKIFIALILGSFFMMPKSFATTFRPMPLEQLVEEASGAAEVKLKSKKPFMNSMGMIFTEYTFEMLESHNVSDADLDGEFLKLTMTGGSVNGVTSFIDGAPEFEVGEKSFLLLKKIESKIYLSNFTMGKYKIEESEGKTFYVSSVFPNDAELGRVSKEKMIDLVKLKFKITRVPEEDRRSAPSFEDSREQKLFQKMSADDKRSPAQVHVANESDHDGLMVMWFFFSLFLVSAITIWWKLKKGVSV